MKPISAFVRQDGRVGVRNHFLVISSSACANDVVTKIASQLPGAVAVTHQHGCGHLLDEDIAQTRRTLIGNASNPNVGACLFVGLGCELLKAADLAEEVRHIAGGLVESVCIQEEGGSISATIKGIEVGCGLFQKKERYYRRTLVPVDMLTAAFVGNSDDRRGVADGSMLGGLSDVLLDAGLSVMQGETAEFFALPEEICGRLAGERNKRSMADALARVESKLNFLKADAGHILTEDTAQDKLKCFGRHPVAEVVGYSCKTQEKGLIHMESTRFMPEVISGMTAGGAQIILKVARGADCAASPVAPTVHLRRSDFKRPGDPLPVLSALTEIAEGRRTVAEFEGWNTFAITRIGPST